MKHSDPGRDFSTHSLMDANSSFMRRAIATTWYPSSVSLRTIPRPIPRLPPVTITLRIITNQFACSGNFQRGDATDRNRDLVCGQALAAGLDDLTFIRGNTIMAAQIGFLFQDDVS